MARVVLMGEAYTPARAAAAWAAGRAAPAGAVTKAADAILVPSPAMLAAVACAAPCPPVVHAADFYQPDQRLDAFGLAREVVAHAAGGGVAVDASSPAFFVLDPHQDRAAELCRGIARGLYFVPDPPVIVQFVPPALLPYHLREWLRLTSGESLETRKDDFAGDPGFRMRFHNAFAESQRQLHHPWSRLKRKLNEKRARLPRRPRLPSLRTLAVVAGLAYLGAAYFAPDWLPPRVRLW